MMSMTGYQRGQKDANDGRLAANLWNAPAPEREKYNAGYNNNKK